MLQNDVWNRVFELDGMAAARSGDLAVMSLPAIRYRDRGLVNEEHLELAPEYRGQSAVFGPLRISAVSQLLSFREEGVSAYTSEVITKRQTSENLLGLLIVGTQKNGEELVVRVGPLTNEASKKVFGLISAIPAQDLTSMAPVSAAIDKILEIAIGEKTTVLSNVGATRRDIVAAFRSALVPPVLPPREPEPVQVPDLSKGIMPPAKQESVQVTGRAEHFIKGNPIEQVKILEQLRPTRPKATIIATHLLPLIEFYHAAQDVDTKCRVVHALLHCTVRRGAQGESFHSELLSDLKNTKTPEKIRAMIARVLIHKVKSQGDDLSREHIDFILSLVGKSETSLMVRTQSILALAGRATRIDAVAVILATIIRESLAQPKVASPHIFAAAVRASFPFSHSDLHNALRSIGRESPQAIQREVLFARRQVFNLDSPHYWDLSRGPKGEVLS